MPTPLRPFLRYRPHPWHGVPVGPHPPELVHAYVEITPFDTVKFEVDKETGFLSVDRPQLTNSLPPELYGFVPRTYCGPRVAALAGTEHGDGDPLDICVISERPIHRADILLRARVLGGLLMVDKGEADDKIIAVLVGDALFGTATDVAELPRALVDRLRHYFLTYKLTPGGGNPVDVSEVYGAGRACDVVRAAMADYLEAFGD